MGNTIDSFLVMLVVLVVLVMVVAVVVVHGRNFGTIISTTTDLRVRYYSSMELRKLGVDLHTWGRTCE